MTAPKAAARGRLRDATGIAIDLGRKLERIVAIPVSKIGRGGVKRGRIDHSQPPWNAPVAHLILEMHALSRLLEDDLRDALNMSWQPRGGDDQNTVFALQAIANLAESAKDGDIFEAMRLIENWNSRALVVLGERDLPKRLPREVGQSEPQCPYCGHFTLRFWSSRGEVRCVNPGCFDETKKRPVARMEYSVITQDWVLAWRDGSVGVPAPRATDERTADEQ